MDTSTLEDRADTLGRRVVPRRFRSLEDKLQIIDEARAPGASVAAVARAHGVNANLVFAWMRQQEQGLLSARSRRSAPALLAVTVEPSAAKETASSAVRTARATERIEVELPDGTCVRAFGAVPWDGLERVLRLLRR
jgi:transposase-like protein